VTGDLRSTKLYRAVIAARSRLRMAEDKHEHVLDEGLANHRGVIREYAAAVQEYTNTVMAWLSSVETHGQSEEPLPDGMEEGAGEPATEV
jgi:hypothetical protein